MYTQNVHTKKYVKTFDKIIKYNDYTEFYKPMLKSMNLYKIYPDKINQVINADSHLVIGWWRFLAPPKNEHEEKMLRSISYEINKRFYTTPSVDTQN
jgi:hypothetical protein